MDCDRRRLPSVVSPRWRWCLALALAVMVAHTAAAEKRFKPFTFKNLDGGRTSLTSVQGKATLIIFFFPTCAFCNVALPEIQRLYETYKDRGLSVVGVNVLPEEERLISGWRQMHGYTIPIVLGGRSVQDDYKLTMTPTHVLIDAEGRVLSRRSGFTRGDEAVLEQEIRRALGVGD